ncbi:MAG TPA: hypothetical protein VM487_26215 [Phycisphaerae bacterium]|nr:hypothetical protein [Phycisphaerae bacterium]
MPPRRREARFLPELILRLSQPAGHTDCAHITVLRRACGRRTPTGIHVDQAGSGDRGSGTSQLAPITGQVLMRWAC